MEKVSVKTKLIILIVLICGFMLLINNNTYAASNKFNLTHYQRTLYINKVNEKGLRVGVIKLPLVNKTWKKEVVWTTSDSKIAIVNQYRICDRYKTRYSYNYC